MRQVKLDATIPGTPPEIVFDTVLHFERYPELAPHVQSTVVHASVPESVGSSSWELHFRSGLLRWTEREEFRRGRLRIDFDQTTGDFADFAGHWQLHVDGTGTRLEFRAEFDFGIPSLEGILDPIAERVIKETVGWVVVGMFPAAVLDDARLQPTPETTAR